MTPARPVSRKRRPGAGSFPGRRRLFRPFFDIPETGGPYVQEHIDLQIAIRDGQEINELRQVAESTLTALMGRISAYTGDNVTWDDVATDSGKYATIRYSPTPQDFENDTVVAPDEEKAPVMGAGDTTAAG